MVAKLLQAFKLGACGSCRQFLQTLKYRLVGVVGKLLGMGDLLHKFKCLWVIALLGIFKIFEQRFFYGFKFKVFAWILVRALEFGALFIVLNLEQCLNSCFKFRALNFGLVSSKSLNFCHTELCIAKWSISKSLSYWQSPCHTERSEVSINLKCEFAPLRRGFFALNLECILNFYGFFARFTHSKWQKFPNSPKFSQNKNKVWIFRYAQNDNALPFLQVDFSPFLQKAQNDNALVILTFLLSYWAQRSIHKIKACLKFCGFFAFFYKRLKMTNSPKNSVKNKDKV